jgi:hypothetical protein
MATHTSNARHTRKSNVGRIFGLCFVALCVFAVVLNVGLPYGSSAASAPAIFSPDVDVAVAQSTPTNAAPTSSQLLAVGGTSQRQSFIRFTVGGLSADAAIQSAKLRLVVTNDSTGNTIVSGVSSNSWPESITWNTKPAIDGAPVAKIPAVTIGQVVEFDLTPAIKGPGTYSFAITSDPANLNTVGFASRENSTVASRPQLIVTLSSGTAGSQTGATATPVSPTSAPSAPTATAVAPTATAVAPTATAAPPPPTQAGCQRPYADSSPWNTKIASSTAYAAKSDYNITALSGTFGSDPTQYTMPVYEVTSSTTVRKVNFSGTFSNVTNNGSSLTNLKGSVQVPIPAGAQPAAGSDGQIILWNRQTGDEWGFSHAYPNSDGTWSASNGYHYNTQWSGVPPAHFASRGAGVPYLTGLIRPCEIAQGHIDHAIAFAYDVPTSQFVYPATKSDGSGTGPDMPEGARLQLDPRLTDTQIQAWGCKGACLIIAHAMQQYGIIIIDKAGHPKVYAEYDGTAHWNGVVTSKTVSSIPYSAFKVLPYAP